MEVIYIMKIPFMQGEKEIEIDEVSRILVEDITVNPYQPRTNFNPSKITELANSIQNYGVIQPIIVRKRGKDYELVAGERRLRACKQLDMKEVPAIIKDISDLELAEIALVENLQRKNLNFIEEATAYQQIIEKFSLTQQELAKKIGKGQSTIANKLRLLTLPTEVCEKLNGENITERHGRALLKLEDSESQLSVLKEIKEKNLNVKDTERLIGKLLNKEEGKKSKVYTVYKDLRLFINTLNNSIDEMKEAGLKVKVEKTEEEEYVEFKVRLPKT